MTSPASEEDSSHPADVARLAADLREAATQSDQRRLLVLAGGRDAGIDAAFDAVAGTELTDERVTFVTTREGFRFERLTPTRADQLLGTTQTLVVCDAHEEFSPNLLGRLVGAVDGGGLLVLLTPPLDEWPTARTNFDDGLAVPPFDAEDVTGNFRRRLVATLRDHPGVAIVDLDRGVVRRDGATDKSPFTRDDRIVVPARADFPLEAYEACLTRDQSRAVATLERLRTPGNAVVVEADRGRGKSSAAGIAAACLAHEGQSVLVTAPQYRNAREVFVRAAALLDTLGVATAHDEESHTIDLSETSGQIQFRRPVDASDDGDADVVIVDEAAALPVRVLTSFLDAPSVGFFTTVHGYEGAGRGFSVRFRDRLDDASQTVTDVRLDDPIRYAPGDPVESWAFRALLLDARPPVDQLVDETTPESTVYESLTPAALLADEHRLREVFGLLVLAHYRTEPDDLARLLDAPNLTLRVLTHEGHVVSVALLAREGGLDGETRRAMYDGARVRGNMLPDVLTSQLRDEDAGAPVGYRVMRIATHHAVRSTGLGSHLLACIREEFSATDPLGAVVAAESTTGVDWLGVGYGATPELVDFWRENGYRTVYLSTSRNETSGEYSAVMLDPLTPAGDDLLDRHSQWFTARIESVLSDLLRDLDADVARATLRAVTEPAPLSLSERNWRLVVDASFGPGLYSANPLAFRQLALRALTDNDAVDDLSAREERLLVRKVLQCQPWPVVTDELDYVSPRRCMKALGAAYQPLVERYGTAEATAHRRRYD